jgi:hypothetical protein
MSLRILQCILLTPILVFISTSCSFGVGSLNVTNDVSDKDLYFDARKICSIDQDCQVVDQDCCQAGDLIAVNKTNFIQTTSLINQKCREQRTKAIDTALKQGKQPEQFCKNKEKPFAAQQAIVQCIDKQCQIKTPQETASKTEPTCEADFQCKILDEDCCNTGSNLVVVHQSKYEEKRREKAKSCSDQFKANIDLCKGKTPLRDRYSKKAACENSTCVLK